MTKSFSLQCSKWFWFNFGVILKTRTRINAHFNLNQVNVNLSGLCEMFCPQRETRLLQRVSSSRTNVSRLLITALFHGHRRTKQTRGQMHITLLISDHHTTTTSEVVHALCWMTGAGVLHEAAQKPSSGSGLCFTRCVFQPVTRGLMSRPGNLTHDRNEPQAANCSRSVRRQRWCTERSKQTGESSWVSWM